MSFLLRLVGWFIYLMPRSLRISLGNRLGYLLRVGHYRDKVVEQNLKYAFPNESQTRERVFRQAYSHFGNLILELFLIFGPFSRYLKMHSDLVGGNILKKVLLPGKGAILLASHVGNWEVMAGTGAVLGNFDILIVTKRLKPEWLHQAVEGARKRAGYLATYEPKTFKDILKHLKAGNAVGFVLDQYAGAPVGVRVPVFGVPVGTMTAVAMLAKRTGAPVVPVVNYRTSDGRTLSQVFPPLDWIEDVNPRREIAVNTAHYAKILERLIYTHPAQWLWIHRRFKGDLSPLRLEEWEEGRTRK